MARSSASSTTPWPATRVTRTLSWPRHGVTTPCNGSTLRSCRTRNRRPSSSSTATTTCPGCCATPRRSAPATSSTSSWVRSWASTSCWGWTARSTAGTGPWSRRRSVRRSWPGGRASSPWNASPPHRQVRRPGSRRAGARVHLSLSDPDHRRHPRPAAEDYKQFQRWSIAILSFLSKQEEAIAASQQVKEYVADDPRGPPPPAPGRPHLRPRPSRARR